MGILSRVFERRASIDLANVDDIEVIRMLRGDSGTVTPASSLQIAAVFACTRVLAESIAMLPLQLMEKDGRNRQPAEGHPLYNILYLLPNPWMTSTELRMTLQGHLATRGNAYCQIVYDNAGRRRELWPLNPDRMQVVVDGNRRIYHYQLGDGRFTDFADWEVMHVRGLSPDGLVGYSPVTVARRAFELKMQMEEYETAFYANSARPDILLRHPKVLSQKARENILSSWEGRHKGPEKAGRPAILEEGLDVTTLGIPQADAQFLESQKFSRSEIASLFRVPLHMVGDLDRATFSNIEEQAQEFVDYTLGPWIRLWEQAIARDLLTPSERNRYYAHFTVQALLKGKHTDRAAFYSSLFQMGALSPNEIREKEDLNPVEDGDVYLVPLNMEELSDAGEPQQDPSQPDPGGADPMQGQDQPDQPDPEDMMDAQRAAFQPIIIDAAQRAAKRLAQDVRQQGGKALRKGNVDGFAAWLSAYAADAAAPTADILRPCVRGYGVAAHAPHGAVMDALDELVRRHLAALAEEGTAIMTEMDEVEPEERLAHIVHIIEQGSEWLADQARRCAEVK